MAIFFTNNAQKPFFVCVRAGFLIYLDECSCVRDLTARFLSLNQKFVLFRFDQNGLNFALKNEGGEGRQ